MQDTNIESLEGEIWKDIPGYEGCYQASNMGRVKSLDRYIVYGKGTKYFLLGKILKPQKHMGGYVQYSLERKIILAHRIIAMTFLENKELLKTVNHKNGVKNDNRVINLEWMSQGDNARHSYRYLNRKKSKAWLGKKGKLNASSKKIVSIDMYGNKTFYFGSFEANRLTGLNQANIIQCCRGKRYKKVGGYKWEYAED